MGLETALRWFADWQGQTGEVKVKINTDFLPMAMDAPTLTALVAAWQAGAISHEVLFDNLQQGEIIAPDKTFEDEKSSIEISGPVLTAPAATPPVANEPPAKPAASVLTQKAA